jgi:hypothetical protein
MNIRVLQALLAILLLVSACTDTQRYPITGEDCAPIDPVQDLSLQQCAPPV